MEGETQIQPTEEQDIIESEQEEVGISEEEIAKLLKNKSKLVLEVQEWKRPGPSFADWGVLKVLFGEIEKIELDSQYDYPTTSSTTSAIIPKSRVVVLLFKWGNDYSGEFVEHAELYVFSYSYPKGWKTISLY